MMTIEYTDGSSGRHTCATYRDKNGTPMASRFAGWWPPQEVERYIENCRKADRNRGAC